MALRHKWSWSSGVEQHPFLCGQKVAWPPWGSSPEWTLHCPGVRPLWCCGAILPICGVGDRLGLWGPKHWWEQWFVCRWSHFGCSAGCVWEQPCLGEVWLAAPCQGLAARAGDALMNLGLGGLPWGYVPEQAVETWYVRTRSPSFPEACLKLPCAPWPILRCFPSSERCSKTSHWKLSVEIQTTPAVLVSYTRAAGDVFYDKIRRGKSHSWALTMNIICSRLLSPAFLGLKSFK